MNWVKQLIFKKCLVLFLKALAPLRGFDENEIKPNGKDGAGEALIHSPVCVHLHWEQSGVPGGQYQVEAESCTEQVNQGSYQGEIKDGGNQTSTCKKQCLTSTEKQASGSPDLR